MQQTSATGLGIFLNKFNLALSKGLRFNVRSQYPWHCYPDKLTQILTASNFAGSLKICW